jgi:hypothetical protein
MSTTNVLYFSHLCQFSKKFIGALRNTPMFATFALLNVSNRRVPRPPFLKKTPSVIVTGDTGAKVIHQGEDAFVWLNKILEKPIELEAFGWSSLSENFSDLDGNDVSGMGNFVSPDHNSESIYTPTEDVLGKTTKSDISSMLSQVEAQREFDMQNVADLGALDAPVAASEEPKTYDRKYQSMQANRAALGKEQLRGGKPMHMPDMFNDLLPGGDGFGGGTGGGFLGGSDHMENKRAQKTQHFNIKRRNVDPSKGGFQYAPGTLRRFQGVKDIISSLLPGPSQQGAGPQQRQMNPAQARERQMQQRREMAFKRQQQMLEQKRQAELRAMQARRAQMQRQRPPQQMQQQRPQRGGMGGGWGAPQRQRQPQRQGQRGQFRQQGNQPAWAQSFGRGLLD